MDAISPASRPVARPEGDAPAYEVLAPHGRRVPVVVASPHSGNHYPPEFLTASRLDPITLRRSEDCFVDELFDGARTAGAPLVRALFPRAYVDVNREPFELDPGMFEDALPDYVRTRSPRVAAGLGTIARIVANGCDIYDRKLRFADALSRISRLYRPYHAALARLIAETKAGFGVCVLLDAHSMPSQRGCSAWNDRPHADFVIGDGHGTACDARIPVLVERTLRELGYSVARNDPYPGGYTTRHYGRPGSGVHALQIEVDRSLYMDEATLERRAHLATLREQLAQVVAVVGAAARLMPAGR